MNSFLCRFCKIFDALRISCWLNFSSLFFIFQDRIFESIIGCLLAQSFKLEFLFILDIDFYAVFVYKVDLLVLFYYSCHYFELYKFTFLSFNLYNAWNWSILVWNLFKGKFFTAAGASLRISLFYGFFSSS